MKTKFSLVSALILMFCFTPLKNSGQEISTVEEIYDFNVGDIFHFDENGPNYTIFNIEIISKYYSTDMDTLFYIRDLSSQMISPQNPEWTYEYYLDTIYYTDLEQPINNGNIDTVYSDPLFYNGRQINFFHDLISIDEYWNYTFVNGCGLAISQNEGGPPLSYIKELVYYKKGIEEWGTPLFVGLDENPYLEKNIQVFPNPATSFITININGGQPIEETIIYNHLGQKALVAVPVNNTVDVSKLKPGIYFLEVETKESRIRQKLMIE